MRPLTLVFAGFLVVTVDLNLLVGIDVLLDPVGWAMVVTGVSRLARRDRAFVVAECFGIAGLAVSVAAFVPPFGAVDLVRVADSVVQTGFVVAVCTGLMAIALDDDAGRRQADVIRWADIALTVVAVAVTLVARVTVDRLEPGAGSVGAGAGGLVLLLALAGLAVRVWFLGLLWSRSNRVYAGA